MRHILTFVFLLLLSQISSAEKPWPNNNNEPIRIIVTFTPGGAPDILARILAEYWQKDFNNQVIVDNKPGAGGNIGTELAIKAPPDGHTLLIGTVGTLTINPYLYKNLNFDAHKDLEPLTFLASTPNVLVLNKNVPADDVKSFIKLAKSKPDNFSYSSSGIGTSLHLSGELFQSLTHTKMRHIPYKGRAQAIPDLLGGRVQMSVDNLSSALPLIRAGEIKAIGVTSANRSSTAPEIPSLSESGVPQLKNFHVTSWFSLMGPSGMSKEDILKITAETKRIFNLPEVKDRLLQLGLEPNPQGPAALKKLIQADSKRWSKLIQETGIKAE
jgi:tripartite-type tricarboxylate transporter receptor subunit TctC